MGSINDQVPLFYEEPHPLTEPEADKLVIIQVEPRSMLQREASMRATTEDTLNFIPWATTSEVTYELSEILHYVGDDLVKAKESFFVIKIMKIYVLRSYI